MCTRIAISDKNGKAYVGRTMDFASKVGESYGEWLPGDHISFTTKYAFKAKYSDVANLARMVSDGVNDQGLSLETLWLPEPETQFNTAIGYRPPNGYINGLFVAQTILGNCKNVDEVKAFFQDPNHKIWVPTAFLEKYATIHISVSDTHIDPKTGVPKTIVIEFRDKGTPFIYENGLGVMTNAPSFPWHVTNMRNFTQMIDENKPSNNFMEQEFQHTGFGANQLGLPGAADPVSRFARAVILMSKAISHKRPENRDQALVLMDKVLGSVSVIEGTSADGNKYDSTLWTVFKSLNDYANAYMQKSGDSPNWSRIDPTPIKGSDDLEPSAA